MKDPSTLAIPELSLVLLIGTSGSGKSTFARRHFLPSEVVGSDQCRAMLADDENDQTVTGEAFALLHHIVGMRLKRGKMAVADATNLRREDRAALVNIARATTRFPSPLFSISRREHAMRGTNRGRTVISARM